MAKVGIVFISGAGLGSWIWKEVQSELELPSIVIEYPSRLSNGRTREQFYLQDYRDEVLRQIEVAGFENIILVSHSIGGVVGLQVAAVLKRKLVKMAAVSAAIPEKGKNALSTSPFLVRILGSILIRLFGTTPPKAAIQASLCNDLPPELAQKVADTYAPESTHLYFDANEVDPPACPKLYIQLTKDHSLTLSTQKKMTKNLGNPQLAQLETGHLPMLADPIGLAKLLKQFMDF